MRRSLLLFFLILVQNIVIGCAPDPSACFDGRPIYHFAPPANWTNDPNGLVFIDGVYHLFYQHNPFGMTWGHMTWGHAVSTNLLTWEHWPIAIPEDSLMIFSGSAVYDSLNTSGFGDSSGCLVAIYTAHRSGRQTQAIAYSVDNGRTWSKYANNPVIDRGMADFRDPKVFWYAPEKKWLMVVALPKEHRTAFYSSPNLIDWELMSEFGPEGKAAGLWECPDLFELPIENTTETKWVLVLSSAGPHEGHAGLQYFVGEFDGSTFINDNPADQMLFIDYGKDFYAGQTYNGLPLHRRTLIAWMSNWAYANETPEKGFRGRMSLPRVMSLHNTSAGLRLAQRPVSMSSLSTILVDEKNIPVAQVNQLLADVPAEKAFFISLKTIDSFSLALKDGTPVFTFDHNTNTVIINRQHDANCFDFSGYATTDAIELFDTIHAAQFDFYVDANSLEIFINQGAQTLSYLMFPGIRLNDLRLSSETEINEIVVSVISVTDD